MCWRCAERHLRLGAPENGSSEPNSQLYLGYDLDPRLDNTKLDQTTGAVTLRTEGVDAAGNTIKQIIKRAYGLTAH